MHIGSGALDGATTMGLEGGPRGPVTGVTANGVPGTKMKPYEGKLTPKELDDVAAFVTALR